MKKSLWTAAALAGCASLLIAWRLSASAEEDDVRQMRELGEAHSRLHERFDAALAKDALAQQLMKDPAELTIAIRGGLVEELTGRVASSYLEQVRLDLNAVDAEKSGELSAPTPLGKVKLGQWHLNLEITHLVGVLRAQQPRVHLRSKDVIDVELPFEIEPAEAVARLELDWDSSGLANVVCKDFKLTRELRGSVPRQRHVLSGAFRLSNDGTSLSATPDFPDHKIQLALDVPPASWAVVEEALRTQNTAGRCGTLLHIDDDIARLHELVAKRIPVGLPSKLFRTLQMPSQMARTVDVNKRPLSVTVIAGALRYESNLLISSASIKLAPAASPPYTGGVTGRR